MLSLIQRQADLRRIRGLLSRSNHLSAAFLVLAVTGLYVALVQRRLIVAFGLIFTANALLVWSLDLMSRARRLIQQYERELE